MIARPLPSPIELRRRLPRFLAGIACLGVGIALTVVSDLGLSPWDVLHQGLSDRTGVPFGQVVVLVGLLVLVAWAPLGERIGVGTVINVLTVGLVIDLTLAVTPEVSGIALRAAALAAGVAVTGVGVGLYIGAGLGPGPRDGLMTAFAARGRSVRVVRTALEVAALAAGWLLGGTVGVGTLLFAFGIGPVAHVALERFSLPPLALPAAAT